MSGPFFPMAFPGDSSAFFTCSAPSHSPPPVTDEHCYTKATVAEVRALVAGRCAVAAPPASVAGTARYPRPAHLLQVPPRRRWAIGSVVGPTDSSISKDQGKDKVDKIQKCGILSKFRDFKSIRLFLVQKMETSKIQKKIQFEIDFKRDSVNFIEVGF